MHIPTRTAGIGALAIAGADLAGCGSNGSDTTSSTATAGKSGAQVEVGNTINYGSFGTTDRASTAPTASRSTSAVRTTR